MRSVCSDTRKKTLNNIAPYGRSAGDARPVRYIACSPWGGAAAKGAPVIKPERVIATTPGAENKKEL